MFSVMDRANEALKELHLSKQEIMDEMVSKVDFERLRILCAIGANNGLGNRVALDAIAPQPLLNAWAEAKWPMYLLLGRELEMTTMIPAVKSEQARCNAFQRQIIDAHPQYRLAFFAMNLNEAVDNKVSYRVDVPKALANYSKVTRLFNNLYHDKALDNDLAAFYDNNNIDMDTIHVSIDPYDYLTVSVNKHNWTSCHDLHRGGYYSGNFAYMCDPSTMVSYRDDLKTYSYDIDGFQFQGNSKQWRMLTFIDLDTGAVLSCRQYYRDNDASLRAVMDAMKKALIQFAGRDLETTITNKESFDSSYCHNSSHGYADTRYRAYPLMAVENEPCTFAVSVDYPCVSCGNIHSNEHALCDDCRDKQRRGVK